MIEFKRENKYLVVKWDDIEKYLNEDEKKSLDRMLKFIRASRQLDEKPKSNNYVVVNEDEPYAEQVWELIKKHQKS